MFEYLNPSSSVDEAEVRELLLRFYRSDVEQFYEVRSGGESRTIPLATRPGWLVPDESINSALCRFEGRETSQYDDSFISSYREKLARDERRNSDIWNGRVYRLVDVEADSVEFSFEVSDYYSYLSDCFRLAVETYDAVARTESEAMTERTPDLPVRRRDADSVNSLTAFENRFCKLGVSTLLVLNPSRGPQLTVFDRRSGAVAEHPDKYHVAPAGSFEPTGDSDDFAEGYDLRALVVREFNEEILSQSGETTDGDAVSLRDVLESGRGDLWTTGFGVELLRGQPELTTLLVVRDARTSDEILENIEPNWELKSRDSPGQMVRELGDRELIEEATSVEAVPAAAMAVCQGLSVLDEHYDYSVPSFFEVTNPRD